MSVLASTAADTLAPRLYLIAAAVVVVFLIAIPLAKIAAHRRRGKIERDLAELTGSSSGISAASDVASDDWWQEQNASERTAQPARASRPAGHRAARPATPTPAPRQPIQTPPHIPHQVTSHAPMPRQHPTPPIAPHSPAPPARHAAPQPDAPTFNGASLEPAADEDWFARQMREEEGR